MAREFDRLGEGHGLLPREIVTEQSIDNSMILDMAMGGSTNTVLHILAIAREAGVEYDIERINQLSQHTPNICKVAPSSKYHVEDVHNCGRHPYHPGHPSARGRPGLLNLDCPTVSGKTLGENIADYDIRATTVDEEALELAAVTAGGVRNAPGMSVATQGPVDRRPFRQAGLRSATIASARSSGPTASRAGWSFSTATWRPTARWSRRRA